MSSWQVVKKLNLKFKERKFLQGSFLSNVFVLTGGTAFSQLVLFLVAPVLTRLYNPTDFGAYALFMAWVAPIAVVASLRYELAVMLPDCERKAQAITVLACVLTFTMSVILFIIIFIFRECYSMVFGTVIEKWVYSIPIMVFLMGINQALAGWSNRSKQYTRIALSQIVQAVFTASISIGLGVYHWGFEGLLAGAIAGYAFGIAIYLGSGVLAFSVVDIKDVLNILKDYSDFPKRSSPAAIINSLSGQIPLYLVGSLYGSSTLGMYSLTLKVLNAPMLIIGKAISQVIYQRASQEYTSGKSRLQLFAKTAQYSFIFISLPMGFLLFSGEWLFELVFGSGWGYAGKIAQVLAPFFAVRFVFSVQSMFLMVTRQLGFELKFNILLLSSQLGALLLGYFLYNDCLWSFVFMSVFGSMAFAFLGWSLYSFIADTKSVSGDGGAR